jgi:hypothetical protein
MYLAKFRYEDKAWAWALANEIGDVIDALEHLIATHDNVFDVEHVNALRFVRAQLVKRCR